MESVYRYYSQNGEDYILTTFFRRKSSGFFIDIGAFDGVHLSNSYSFEQQGWHGICVEPQQLYYDLCRKNRPGTLCIHAACTGDEDIDQIKIETDRTGLFSGLQVNSHAKNISNHYRSLGKELECLKSETVPATTLNKIMLNNKYENVDIDYISVDVEGLEIDVLKGFDLGKYKPGVILVEANSQDDLHKLESYLLDFDYILARSVGPNSFFVKAEDDANHIRNIELTCVIEKQIHPLGVEYSQSEYLDGKIIYKGENGNYLLHNYHNLLAVIDERNSKVSSLLDLLEKTKAERNSKVSSLLDLLEKTKAERDSRVSGLLEQPKKTKAESDGRFSGLLARIKQVIEK